MRNVIIWHWFIKNLVATWRRNDVDATSLRRIDVRHVPDGNLAPPCPPVNILNLAPPQYSKHSYAYGILPEKSFRILSMPVFIPWRASKYIY